MNQKLLNGLLTTKNQLLIFTTILQKLMNTMLLMSHPHMFHITTMNHLPKNTNHMNHPQLHGLATSMNQKLISTITINQLNNIFQKKKSHLHMFHTTIMNHLPKNTTLMSQPQLHGLTSMNNHLLISIIMKNQLKLTFPNMSHLHMFHTHTMNQLPKNTTHTNHPQQSGPVTTMNQKPISIITNHLLTTISKKLNHLHTIHTITMNQLLKLMKFTNHPQLHGLITMNLQ